MNYAKNCCVSNDLNPFSQDKTRPAKNVNNLCVDNNKRESTRKKQFVFHSPQHCSSGFALARRAMPDYPRWTHLLWVLPSPLSALMQPTVDAIATFLPKFTLDLYSFAPLHGLDELFSAGWSPGAEIQLPAPALQMQ